MTAQPEPEFSGDYTVVLFPFLKLLRQKPDAIGTQLGDYLLRKTDIFARYDIVAGFLNLTVKDGYWVSFLLNHYTQTSFGQQCKADCRVMVEYSSPNTNKPLHFGHMRNIFLGAAVSEILKANGKQVVKANLINDRGIHICKSMIAWMHYANGATPESSGIKGDHLVGDYYVKFNDELKKEIKPVLDHLYETGNIPQTIDGKYRNKLSLQIADLGGLKTQLADKNKQVDEIRANNEDDKQLKGLEKEIAAIEGNIESLKDDIKEIVANSSSLMQEAQEMLRKWEAGDKEVRDLWETMNGWVYKGFDSTYRNMGITFDKVYHESETYLLGKKIVEDGLRKGVLFKKEDGSVWVDLKEDGLDEKLLLRGDGTSVYITQDLGTAKLKYDDYRLHQSVYVIADEQNYHIQVLKLIMQKLGEPCANGIYHLSYGMVELPTGRMKSREGTVVDADDMVSEMIRLAQEQTEQAGKTEGFSGDELKKLYEMIGLGALKFYLLRVDPRKKMIFDPKESIDLHGYTATFIQYAHARICSILRREQVPVTPDATRFQSFKQTEDLLKLEKEMMLRLEQYPGVLAEAAVEFNPASLCNYAFGLAQLFNTFYDAHSISKAESEEKKNLRLMIIVMTAAILRHAMGLLGIRMPEKM